MHIRYLNGGYNESKRITTNSLWSMSSRGWSQLNNARFINYNSTKEERNKVKNLPSKNSVKLTYGLKYALFVLESTSISTSAVHL